MRDFDLKQDYFDWLCDIIHVDQFDHSWRLLMKDLYSTSFYSIVPHDENRAGDGLELRAEYMRDTWLPAGAEIEGDCTMLEMLIALARRINFEEIDPYNNSQTDKTSSWFWEMLDNLGLKSFDDNSYADLGGGKNVKKIIDRFLDREYRRSGEGGLFPLRGTRKDQRRIEIWYQMAEYLAEKKAV